MIEDLISQYPGVSELAVIGISDEKWGERPLALIVLQQESVGAVTEQHIQAHVRAWAERGSFPNGRCQKFALWTCWRRPALANWTRKSCARSTARTGRLKKVEKR
jgi:acyl-CoA synthetase (AMP-forming)/AMP-acid ligase II